jgi:hypothetical protein
MTTIRKPKIERRAKKRCRTALHVSLHLGTQATTVSTHDVCQNGLSCYLPEPLQLFTKYRFRLFVPHSDSKLTEIDGEGIVVRVEEVEREENNVFQTAFFFQHLDPGHTEILENFLVEEGHENEALS